MRKKECCVMATIATHNGSSVSRGHNMRKEEIVSKESHIDPEGIHETWHDEAPRKAYERLFGQAVKEYNNKQVRSDRKILNYYNEVRDDQRRHVTYEMIIGIYPGEGEHVTQDTGKDIMREFVNTWRERNPNLELVGAYYHADEQGAPHVHIDYIPVAHGYQRGPAVQNGLVKALGEMGFDGKGKNTAQIQWERRENEALEKLCNSKGIIVEHPQERKGVKHVHTQIYKAEQDLEKTKNESKLYKQKIEHQEKYITHIFKQKSQTVEELEQAEERKQELEKEILKKSEELKSISVSLQNAHKQVLEIREDISGLEEEKKNLEGNMEAMRSKLQAKMEDICKKFEHNEKVLKKQEMRVKRFMEPFKMILMEFSQRTNDALAFLKDNKYDEAEEAIKKAHNNAVHKIDVDLKEDKDISQLLKNHVNEQTEGIQKNIRRHRRR